MSSFPLAEVAGWTLNVVGVVAGVVSAYTGWVCMRQVTGKFGNLPLRAKVIDVSPIYPALEDGSQQFSEELFGRIEVSEARIDNNANAVVRS